MKIHCEDENFNHEAVELVHSLYDFMKNKYKFSREPKVFFLVDEENSKNILGKTGFYDPKEESVHVYVTNRHPKDVLRSFAHELLHHIQGCEGMVKADRGDAEGTKDPNYFIHDQFLRKIELDAFKRGNDAFREWEAHIKQGDIKVSDKKLEEAKMAKKDIVKAHKLGKKLSHKKDIDNPYALSTWMVQHKKAEEESYEEEMEEGWHEEEESLQENKEVQVNDALKNSLYYVKEDRAMGAAYETRDEKVYNELLRKFKIKK